MRPRTCGLSFSSRTSLSLFRLRARTERRWRAWVPRRARTRRTLTVLLDSLAIEEFLHLLAALGRDALGRLHRRQALHGGADQVDRVARTDGLGQHVLHAHGFQDGAHRATGDHTGTIGSRLHEHAGRAVAGLDRVPQGAVVQVDLDHRLAGVFHRLLDGHRDLAGFAVAEADAALAVADHGQRGEGELAAALDGLADAVDRDQLLDHAVVDLLFAVAVAIAAPRCTFFCHVEFLGCWICTARAACCCWSTAVERHASAEGRRRPAPPAPAGRARSEPAESELQAALAGRVGQGLDAPVVTVARTVEGDLLDARGPGTLGDDAADLGRGLGVLAVLQALLHLGLQRVRRDDDLGAVGGEQLGVQVLAGAQHRQARNAELADVRAGGLGTAQTGVVLDAHVGYLVEADRRRRVAPGRGPGAAAPD